MGRTNQIGGAKWLRTTVVEVRQALTITISYLSSQNDKTGSVVM